VAHGVAKLCLSDNDVIPGCCPDDRRPLPPFHASSIAHRSRSKEIRSPVAATIDDPCAQEKIAFSGYMNSLLTFTSTPQGVTISESLTGYSVKGVGETTGTVYGVHCTNKNTRVQLDDETLAIVQGPETEPSLEISSVLVLCIVSHNNAILTTRSHTVMTPDGDFAVDFTVEDFRCAER
jgi:hypothetical protein